MANESPPISAEGKRTPIAECNNGHPQFAPIQTERRNGCRTCQEGCGALVTTYFGTLVAR